MTYEITTKSIIQFDEKVFEEFDSEDIELFENLELIKIFEKNGFPKKLGVFLIADTFRQMKKITGHDLKDIPMDKKKEAFEELNQRMREIFKEYYSQGNSMKVTEIKQIA